MSAYFVMDIIFGKDVFSNGIIYTKYTQNPNTVEPRSTLLPSPHL